MLVGLIENASTIWKVADVFAWWKKLILTSAAKTPDAQLQMDLERLALSAPHVLADLGFEREVGACAPDVDVWHRQDIPLVIQFSSTTSVSARRPNRRGS